MLLTYTYKLIPSHNLALVMERHVEMLRLQYNFQIRERTEAYKQASHLAFKPEKLSIVD